MTRREKAARRPARTQAAARPAGPDLAGAAAWTWAALGLAALLAAALLALDLGPHSIGDSFTETDFYGAYGPGARAIQQGHFDASRYGVIGPMYEGLLALAGFVAPGLFAAANAISLLSTVASLLFWFFLLRRRADARLAFFACLFLATNTHFFRYGWSAATDALALALVSAALWLLLARSGWLAPLLAGAAAALAFLTRYNAGVLLPAGLLVIALGGAAASVGRGRAAALYLAGFALPVLPWLVVSAGARHVPGGELFHNIAYEVFAHARGLTWDDYQQHLQPGFHSMGDVLARDPGAVLRRLAFNFVDHAGQDARKLLTWPVGVAAGLGLLACLRGARARQLWPVALACTVFYLTLVPVAYSERYSLAVLPLYAALAAAALAPARGSRPAHALLGLRPWLVVVPVAFAAWSCVRAQARAVDRLPREVLDAAAALRPLAGPGDAVIARKPHLAWQSGLRAVPFPFAGSWGALASAAREQGARWLYFSYVEAETRTRFAVLLDTTAHVPGLTARSASRDVGAVLYEIGPEFGREPAWMADEAQRVYHEARARLVISEADLQALQMLGRVENLRGNYAQARTWLERAVAAHPSDAQSWSLLGDACVNSGDGPRAARAFARAQELAPGEPTLPLKRGWAELMVGHTARAAELWRPVIGTARDPEVLKRMVAVFEAVGDGDAAEQARRALAGLAAGR